MHILHNENAKIQLLNYTRYDLQHYTSYENERSRFPDVIGESLFLFFINTTRKQYINTTKEKVCQFKGAYTNVNTCPSVATGRIKLNSDNEWKLSIGDRGALTPNFQSRKGWKIQNDGQYPYFLKNSLLFNSPMTLSGEDRRMSSSE